MGFYYIFKRFLEGKAVSSLGVVVVVFGGWFQYFVFSSSKTIIPNLGSLYSAATDDALCYYLWCFLNSNLNAFVPQLQSHATFQCYNTQVISQMDHLIRIDSSLEARSAIRSNQRSLWPSLEVAKGDQEQMPQEIAKTRQARITPLQLSTGFKTLQAHTLWTRGGTSVFNHLSELPISPFAFRCMWKNNFSPPPACGAGEEAALFAPLWTC